MKNCFSTRFPWKRLRKSATASRRREKLILMLFQSRRQAESHPRFVTRRLPRQKARSAPRGSPLFYLLSAAFLSFPPQLGSSKHLRNPGTTMACSNDGSLRFARVSLTRLASDPYPTFS